MVICTFEPCIVNPMPAVSVIMPVFNAAATLPAAVESILSQTETSWELIVVDDGSDDGTEDFLAGLSDRRVHTIRIPRSGIVSALNAGLSRARGRYIARMDADDYSFPERLALQRQYLDAHPGVGLAGCCVAFGGSRTSQKGYAHYVAWTNSLTAPGQISLSRFVESPFAHPSIMFRHGLVDRFGGYREGPFPEDYELILRWLSCGVHMAKLPDVLLQWNDGARRLSRTDDRYSVDAFYALKARYLAAWLKDNNPLHPQVVIWGAGRITRRRAAMLEKHGIACAGYIDIDPKKTGAPLHGLPRWYYRDIPGPGEMFVLTFVWARNARQLSSSFLRQRGFVEGRHFLHCA